MYERSAIILERYFNSLLGFDQKMNLKVVYKSYKEIIEDAEVYQNLTKDEDKIIREFDEIAEEIRKIQEQHKEVYEANSRLEEYRNQLFCNIDDDYTSIEKKLKKIEANIDRNSVLEENLRMEFVQALKKISDRQVERKRYSRVRREEEAKHLQIIQKNQNCISQINEKIIQKIKKNAENEFANYKDQIIDAMIENGKNEKVEFNKKVIENAVKVRCEIGKEEAKCYILVYESLKKAVIELNRDDAINVERHKKILRDVGAKLAFLKAEKSYIFSFLDNERMTSFNGATLHKQLMRDACEKLELDIEQIDKLYKLLLKEIAGTADEEAYEELYNKEYLNNIEDKEKTFEKQVDNMRMRTGTVINLNSWRIEEVKNIYDVFQKEVSEKFGRDLSEYKLGYDDTREYTEDDIFKKKAFISEAEAEIELYDDDDYEFEDDEIDENDSNLNMKNDEEDYDSDDYNEEDEDEDNYDSDDYDKEDEDEDDYDDDYDEEDEEEDDYDDDYDEEDEDEDDYDDDYDEEDEDEDNYDDDYDEEDEEDEDEEDYDDEYDEDEEDEYDDDSSYENLAENKKEKGIFNKLFSDKKKKK